MNKALSFFIFFSLYLLAHSTNWDSIYGVNQQATKLIDSQLQTAKVMNGSIVEFISNKTPDTVSCAFWNLETKIAFYEGNFNTAIQNNLKFLDFAEKLKDTLKIHDAIIILGTINYYSGAYKEAIKYLNQSIQLVHTSSLPEIKVASPYNTLGALYNTLNQPDSSINYYNKAIDALANDSSGDSQYMRGIIYSNLGLLYLAKEELSNAENFLLKGIYYNQRVGRNSGLAWCKNHLGEVYLAQNKLDKARIMLEEADSLSHLSATFELKSENKYSLLKYHLKKARNNEALRTLQQYRILVDSLIISKTNSNIDEFQTKYEVEKKEASLQLSIEKAKKLALENKAQNQLLLLAIAGMFILALVILYIYRNFKQKTRLDGLELQIKDSRLDELLSSQESNAYAAILQGQETERERIAQDLHDRLGGTLAALKLALRKPENKVAPDDLAIIDLAVNEVRSIAHNLSTGLVYKYGLNEAINQLFRTLEQSKGIEFSLYLHPKTPTLGQSAGIELYRIVQELVSNTIKHAQATEVSLQTNFSDETFNLIFEDNGVGFDSKQKKGGIGLENINARVKRLGGELHIDTEKGRGSIFIVEIKKNI